MSLSLHQQNRKFNGANQLEALIELAIQHNLKNSPEAVEIAQQALRLAEVQNVTENLQAILCILAQDQINKREFTSARKLLNRAELMAISADDWCTQARIHRMHHWLAHDALDWEKSLHHINRSIEILAARNRFDFNGHCFLAKQYLEMGLFAEALETAHKVVHKLPEADAITKLNTYAIWGLIAAVHLSMGDSKRFTKANDHAIKLAESYGDKHGVANGLNRRACAMFMNTIPGDPRATFYRALKLHEQNNDIKYYIHSLINYINALCLDNKKNLGHKLLTKAIALARKHKIEKTIIFACATMGGFYNSQEQFAKAIAPYDEALALAKRGNLVFDQIKVHEGLVASYAGLGLSEKELYHSRQLLELKNTYYGDMVRHKVAAIHSHFESQRSVINKEVERMQNMTLHNQIDELNQQLTKMATVLARRNAALKMIEQQRKSLFHSKTGPSGAEEERLAATIEQSLRSEPSWSEFEQLFASVNGDFLHNLTQQFPDLTPSELKICTLLKLNMSTHKIAETLFLSAHTVNTHRQKIRRKLKLKRGANLVSFLQQITRD